MNHHFGKVWKSYLDQHFSAERVEDARNSILGFLDRQDLNGLSMIDIGCGSGLFSYAAFESGACPLFSVDYDGLAVDCAKRLWEHAGKPQDWNIQQGSILNDPKALNIPRSDLVYAWGTLQHTGDMWKAFRHSAEMIKPGGLFYVAVYNEVSGVGLRSSKFWIEVKRIYSRLPTLFQEIVFWLFKAGFSIVRLLRFQKPVKAMRRGMDHDVNLRAWLGAWPCEFAKADKVIRFCEGELRLKVIRTHLTDRLANNEFLFQKPFDL
ncbi:MAG: class I SAM-dependent methyltransferase [Candidatus Omnitrophica bacterium]|nr:class I SAM-dependent methyltransferase [Candidatus Omnitrophota bacterium]